MPNLPTSNAKPEVTTLQVARVTFHTVCGTDYEVTVMALPYESQAECLLRHATDAQRQIDRLQRMASRLLAAL